MTQHSTEIIGFVHSVTSVYYNTHDFKIPLLVDTENFGQEGESEHDIRFSIAHVALYLCLTQCVASAELGNVCSYCGRRSAYFTSKRHVILMHVTHSHNNGLNNSFIQVGSLLLPIN